MKLSSWILLSLIAAPSFAATPPPAAIRLQLTITRNAGDNFGASVASAGDVNGDGYADVIVGAPNDSTNGPNSGRAFVYFGGPGADAAPDWILFPFTQPGDHFGASVASAGDMNGDGYSDVIVGTPSSGPGVGGAFVFYGGPVPDTGPDLIFSGPMPNAFFGCSVASAGDMNGDGYSDVIVGADGNSNGGTNAGSATLFLGSRLGDTTPDLIVTGSPGDELGFSVGSSGDVNRDGFSDIIVGAPFNSAGGSSAGRAYVYFGSHQPDGGVDWTLTGQAANQQLGTSVASAGDVNGDGYADVVAGAPQATTSVFLSGAVYVWFGGVAPDVAPDWILQGEGIGDSFGYSVAGAGDVNRDGFADVIVGALYNNSGANNAGRAYVYYGGTAPDPLADHTLTGPALNEVFGSTVAAAGDVNGDGFSDVIVGTGFNGSMLTGHAFLYDFNRYFVTTPNGGETWPVGALRTIRWSGAEPAEVSLSVDGGRTFDLLFSGLGGNPTNVLEMRVPHAPTKFARVKVAPSNTLLRGADQSDSMFTIQTSVALLALLAAPAPQGASGAVITWNTDPGPADLAGYKLEKSTPGSTWTTLAALLRETTYTDAAAGPATRYRLSAVNGFGEELMLGETSFRPAAPLTAWPLPYRSGNLSIAFATRGGLAGAPGHAEVSLFDAGGRFVRTIARGDYPAGYQSATWDGRDARGRAVAAGVYFIRSSSEGTNRTMKFVVLH